MNETHWMNGKFMEWIYLFIDKNLEAREPEG